MKKLVFLIFPILLISCGGQENDTSSNIEESSSSNIEESSSSNIEESSSSDLSPHMQFVNEPAEIYFATDLSNNVIENMTFGFELVQERFGKYPLEVLVVGLERAAMDELAYEYCIRKEEVGALDWLNRTIDQCVEYKESELERYLDVGLTVIDKGYPNSGEKGHNGGIEFGRHEFTWSYPVGLESKSAEGYNDEIIAIAHEYWHAFQIAHIDAVDNCFENICDFNREKLNELMGPVSFVEGTAVFMEWIYGQELKEKEILTNVRPLEDLFSNRYRSGLEDMKKCPDKNIEDVTYEDSCRQAVYNLGPWTAAYLAYKVGNPYVFEEKFYPLLKELEDYDETFLQTFGISTDEFYADFKVWINSPASERNIVIPTGIGSPTGRFYLFDDSTNNEDENTTTTTVQESSSQTTTIGLTQDNYFDPFTKYIEVQNLRFFITPEVSDRFAIQVSQIYELMLGNNNLIDNSLRNGYFETLSNEYVFQRVGYSGPGYYEEKTGKNFDEALNPHPFKGPYRDNMTDYIWEVPDANTDEKIGEIVEHLLHTITNVALAYTHQEWNWMQNSDIYYATMEAINNNVFDVSDYQQILDRGDDEGYYSIITQEFMFWVIVVEWGLADIYELPHNEFSVSSPAEIESKLPLAHKLYEDFIAKIFTPPSIDDLRAILGSY